MVKFSLMRTFLRSMGLLALIWGPGNEWNSAYSETYVVKERDNLSSIAQSYIGSPVYTRNGSLKRIIDLNPQIENWALIYPDQKINIDDAVVRGVTANATQRKSVAEVKAKKLNTSRKPSSESVIPAEAEFKQFGSLTLLPTASYFGMATVDKGTASRAVFLSKLSPGADLKWAQHWSETFQTFLELQYQRMQFQEFENKTLSPSSLYLGGFQIGSKSSLGKRMKLLSAFGMTEELFPRATSANALKLDSVQIYKLSLGLDYILYSSEVFILNSYLGSILLSPALTGHKPNIHCLKSPQV